MPGSWPLCLQAGQAYYLRPKKEGRRERVEEREREVEGEGGREREREREREM